MRVLVEFTPLRDVPFQKVNKHTVQGMLYYRLVGTKYEYLHSRRGFKFFTFSDIFPSSGFYAGKKYSFIISTPMRGLAETWYRSFRKTEYMYLSDEAFKIVGVRKYTLKPKNMFISGSPVVVFKDSGRNIPFSFRDGGDLGFFMRRIADNAVKKYNALYNDEFELENPIFDRFNLRKEVAVRVTVGERDFNIIGSVWRLLGRSWIEKDEMKFYRFIMDAGIGEKNSLGFGFVNPVKEA